MHQSWRIDHICDVLINWLTRACYINRRTVSGRVPLQNHKKPQCLFDFKFKSKQSVHAQNAINELNVRTWRILRWIEAYNYERQMKWRKKKIKMMKLIIFSHFHLRLLHFNSIQWNVCPLASLRIHHTASNWMTLIYIKLKSMCEKCSIHPKELNNSQLFPSPFSVQLAKVQFSP